MKYLKAFNNHFDYEDYMDNNEVPIPNVSYCDEEDEVHYNNVMVLPENEEVWELYSSLVCDEERLAEDLKNIFSKYEVTVENCSKQETTGGIHPEVKYVDSGHLFKYRESGGIGWYECKIFTNRTVPYSTYNNLALDAVTNSCGGQVLPGIDGVGLWSYNSGMVIIEPGIS